MTRQIITIDGFAGVGKGTISKLLAEQLNYQYLDSGALYRSLAWYFEQYQIDPLSQAGLDLAQAMPIQFLITKGEMQIIMQGHDITDLIRTPEVALLASKIAALPQIRAALIETQRNFALPNNLIADGRDMGTNIFPQAKYKFYLEASTEIRAERRALQLGISDPQQKAEIAQQIIARDTKDRVNSMPAIDAIIIDTSSLTIPQVLATIIKTITN